MYKDIQTIASNIMLQAYNWNGQFHQTTIGFGFEELPEDEKGEVLKILNRYGKLEDCLPNPWYFSRFVLNDDGYKLHKEYGNYQSYLSLLEQKKRDEELDRQSKVVSIVETRRANRLSEESNEIARKANNKSDISNIIACAALLISLLSLALALFQFCQK